MKWPWTQYSDQGIGLWLTILMMRSFLQALFQADFLPHGWCYRWEPGVVWLHVASDLMIAAAYYMIPLSLVYIVRRRSDLVYPSMFWLFGAFILACGTTHLMSVFVVWYPWYRIDGALKFVTGLISIATAVLMIRVAPAVVALPSPEEIRRMNRQLEREIAERNAAEQEVRQLNAELERRVEERTRELERVNQELRESENRMRAILDSSPSLVYLKDLEGRFLFVNRGFERLTGVAREQIAGKTDRDLFAAEVAEIYRKSDLEVSAKGKVVEVEEMLPTEEAGRVYMSIKIPLLNENGQTYAVCGISSDITERKRSEEDLRRYTSELEQFAFIAAHDLQEPLRTVKSYTQLLTRRYRSRMDADADDFIDFIVGGVDRMEALISGLQAYSELNRMEKMGSATADANQVAAGTLKQMEVGIREADAEVVVHDLPRVRINPVQLGQVLQNLLTNAIKYRHPARPPKIELSAVRDGRDWQFIVKDNGAGFDMKYADQIFGVFRRLHGRDVPGTGIGLAICKKVIETAGGRIWVVSTPEAGSSFHFTIPAA